MDPLNPNSSINGSRGRCQEGEALDDDRAWLHRRGSNFSEASFISNVEMAHDEVFAGPVPESVPSSISSFIHRRNRTDSTASFTYLDESAQDEDWHRRDGEIDGDQDYGFEECEIDLEAGDFSLRRRKSSTYSANSPEDPLLRRHTSTTTEFSLTGRGLRSSQKLYILTEDMTIVVAGFSNSIIGSVIYLFLCIVSFGLAYLLFRWLPRWKIFLMGSATPLRDCSWTVIENQWGEMSLHNVTKQTYGRPLSTVFRSQEKIRIGDEDDDEDPIIKHLRTINYRYVKFFFHPLKDKFVLANDWKDPRWTDVRSTRVGLDGEERDIREKIFGNNVIEIEEKSLFQLLMDEALHPFYVFQVASLILWSLDEYYYYAACIFLISVVSIITTLMETKSTMRRLHEISIFECDIRVLRNGFWRHVSSSELVPGDVYEVTDPSLAQFPCDSLLLSGDCIVNESMLTGESVPVSKIPATNEALNMLNPGASSIPSDISRHFLFCGTKIIRSRRPQNDKDDEAVALGLVVRTGFNTTKGALVRSMLFPKPSGFKFYRDSFRYISVMAVVALLGFIASFVNFIRLKLAWHLVIVRALDLITIVVPPALPATLTIGTNFALSRLRKKGIFCISPQRVNVGGKLDIVCFDKTGTLTEDGLDVLGVRVVQRPIKRFGELLSTSSAVLPGPFQEHDPTLDYDFQKIILHTMATCHSLRSVDNEIVGDPLDIKMFEFTGWSFSEGDQKSAVTDEDGQNKLSPSVARPPEHAQAERANGNRPLELGILKSFEFVSQLRRASVVVRQFGATGGDIYVKGAPECMKDICLEETFPVDYEQLLSYYTHRGFRVIACATKHIPKLNWVKVQKMSRSEAESSLRFVGFIIFENKLKANTTEVLEELGKAGIRRVMCTGDNILTAISVARECSLIDRTAHCFIPRFLEGDRASPNARLIWESVENSDYRLDEFTLKPLPPPPEHDASLPYDMANLRNYTLGISGEIFRWIIDYAPDDVIKRMLVQGEVFARMSPDEKHELVEKLQSLDYSCGFCGDGANDCGALTAADVGISLSEAEASVAAPFTSRIFDISCVPEVIREGRAALVTSFSCFKYMSIYSAIQFTSVSFLYASASNLGDFQFLYIDLLLILPIAIFMGWTGAYPTLCRKRPTASLVSRKVLTPLLGQITLCVITQLIGFELVQKQPWFVPPKIDPDKSNVRNSENTTLFLISCYQYILSAIVLSVGPPFRQSMAYNVPFVITIVIATLFSTYMLFDPANWLCEFMDLTALSTPFKAFLLVLSLAGFICSWFAEQWLFPPIARAIGKARATLRPSHSKQRKQYKILKDEMCRD